MQPEPGLPVPRSRPYTISKDDPGTLRLQERRIARWFSVPFLRSSRNRTGRKLRRRKLRRRKQFLADPTVARSMIGYWHDRRLSVCQCLSVRDEEYCS